MKRKVLVIGLDCAEPSLVFHQWRTELPNISGLMAQGLYGPLTSSIPPVTVPAWASMLTGKDPGQLGLYGFRNRQDRSYAPLALASSTSLKEKTLDQILSRQRLTSILLGVPLTYPPRPLRGRMVSGPLTPNKKVAYTYPGDFKFVLEQAAGGNYIIDVEGFRTEKKEALLAGIYDMTKARFLATSHLLATEPWDFFMMVEMGVDRIHHGFWRYHDQDHRLYEPGHKFEFAIRDYYRYLDNLTGRLVETAPDGTLILIVSDHGAKTMTGGFSLNQWLIQEGYLVLHGLPPEATNLKPGMVDWTRTRAWGEGGYYGRLFLNTAGREPQGQIPAEDYGRLRDEIKARLEAEVDHQGRLMGNRAFKPEEIYRAVKNAPPDLLVYFGDLAWRSVGKVGRDQPLYTFENDTGPDDANHAQEGVLIMTAKGRALDRPAGERSGLTLYDVAPTVLDYLGLNIPEDMIGRVIE